MQQTQSTARRHVAIIGDVNVGKSSLFNALTGQDNAIVSPKRGTTTDPVQKAMELITFGPIVLIDTAGFSDESGLGEARTKKTEDVLRRCDAVLYVMDVKAPAHAAYAEFCATQTPHLLILSKCDLTSEAELAALTGRYPFALPIAENDGTCLNIIRQELVKLLSSLAPKNRPMLADLVSQNGCVLLVTPIDSAAPAGRLILPQAQAIRECLDYGIFCAVTQPAGVAGALRRLGKIDLVITDSQAFAEVDAAVPKEIPLTSFSLLLARQKGDFGEMLRGVKSVESLPEGGKVLVLEGCTHNRTHEDIGRVKIPAMLRKKTGKTLLFDFCGGYDFPDDLDSYALAVQCGSCMLSQAEVENRGRLLSKSGVPYTNYGVLLAWGAGTLARCAAVFEGRA